MKKCVNRCDTRAFVGVRETSRKCVELSTCKHFVVENMAFTGDEATKEYYNCYENSCPGSHPYSVLGEPECLEACQEPYYTPLSGNTCADNCGDYQEPDETRKCVCSETNILH